MSVVDDAAPLGPDEELGVFTPRKFGLELFDDIEDGEWQGAAVVATKQHQPVESKPGCRRERQRRDTNFTRGGHCVARF